jgi:regulator of protease activity HflC (stomatin/prohibitin superfamily)
MATIVHLGPIVHLRAEPNQFIIHFRGGQPVRRGAGQAYWFNPLSAAVVQVPIEDIETTFVLRERSADLQDVVVQCTLTYRVANPERAAERVNFGLSLLSGAWAEQPLERLASLWSQRAQKPVRAYLTGMTVVEAVQRGADVLSAAIEAALRDDPAIAAMGLEVVSVQVVRVAPTADLEKALQTPTREAVQQRADEAVFQRRALAVEKERAIKENEVATELELARRQEELVRQQGANRMLEVDRKVEARRRLAAVEAEADAGRVAVWQAAPPYVIFGLAAQQLAEKVEEIQQLNLSPDLVVALQRALRPQPEG